MAQEILIMTKDEVRCLQVVQKVIAGELKQVEAAKAVGLSDRQLRRLIRRVSVC